ncbi:stage III sporulation protein AG [Clostridium cellulovorans]|uniref:Stage III sporulation protein AG n=1 Tax=Clostridium cellulovorans (strain ATCC 35296 / DSM 3052 / OCM 3 / 743B) TaxID=573061 RepID=D9SLF7_CLOC7|nr:stage III sporulation protein AG [Clostridium cellulovorans]ADL51673.1 stage III sporulation protein AG [Clostridium cellulovorans 743B]
MDIGVIKKLTDFIEKKIGYKNFVVAGLVIGILMVFGSTLLPSKTTNLSKSEVEVSGYSESEYQYKTQLEQQLKSTLSKIKGIGDVDVMIYVSKSEEKVPVFNENNQDSNTKENASSGGERTINQKNDNKTVVTTNNEPFISSTKMPEITGVVVVAQGADNEATRLRITKTVVNLFGLTYDKVNVHSMKN